MGSYNRSGKGFSAGGTQGHQWHCQATAFLSSCKTLAKRVDWRHLQSQKLVLHPALPKAGKTPNFCEKWVDSKSFGIYGLIGGDNWKESELDTSTAWF